MGFVLLLILTYVSALVLKLAGVLTFSWWFLIAPIAAVSFICGVCIAVILLIAWITEG